MSLDTRRRLARVVRRHDADLAEAALCCAAEWVDEPDVDVSLLRIEALADALRAQQPALADPEDAAAALAGHLGEAHGFVGDEATYHDPANALLPLVLDRHRGLPITLSILYVAIGRRLRVPAFPIALPGHVVVGVGGGERPVVLDPFARGRRLDEAALADRVERATGGRLAFRRAMLRPAPAPSVIRRLLNNLTRDLSSDERLRDALASVECKLLLPNRLPDDHRVRGQLLARLGRFDEAARAYETYLDEAPADAPDREEVRRTAIATRARLN